MTHQPARKTLVVLEDTLSVVAMIRVPATFTESDMDAALKPNNYGHSMALQRRPPRVARLDTPEQVACWIDKLMESIG